MSSIFIYSVWVVNVTRYLQTVLSNMRRKTAHCDCLVEIMANTHEMEMSLRTDSVHDLHLADDQSSWPLTFAGHCHNLSLISSDQLRAPTGGRGNRNQG